MRTILFSFCLAAIGCSGPDHTEMLDDMESVAIGMLEVSRDMYCNDPASVPAGDYECAYEGELSLHVYDSRVGEQAASGVVDLGFMDAQLDLVLVDGFADFVVHQVIGHVSMAGSLEVDGEREYEDLFIEVSQIDDDKIQVRGTADGIDFRFDLIQFADSKNSTAPQEDCGFDEWSDFCG